MGKKPPAIYEPGELDRIRSNLGVIDPQEARRIAGLLGGEVGVEKLNTPEPVKKPKKYDETVDVHIGARSSHRKVSRRVELAPLEETERRPRKRKKANRPEHERTQRPKWLERIRMDRLAAQAVFDIKSPSQLVYSMIWIIGDPPDLINPSFTTKRMNEYYSHIEGVVTGTRGLLPPNNIKRIETLRRDSPWELSILETLRDWNLERIGIELARLQSRPREVLASDYMEILRLIYRPLIKLEYLQTNKQIQDAYRALYKVIQQEQPDEAKSRFQGIIKNCLTSYAILKKNVHYLLYPLLMKLTSDICLQYDRFFFDKRTILERFLSINEADKIPASAPEDKKHTLQQENEHTEVKPEASNSDENDSTMNKKSDEDTISMPVDLNEQHLLPRSVQKGLEVLDSLFPKAGWLTANNFPELFPYFTSLFELKKGVELLPPEDPLHQTVVLMHILEELFYGLRFVAFSDISAGENIERLDETMNRIIANWHNHLENMLGKEYFPRLGEYCRILESPSENTQSNYAKRTLSELLWIKRLYFLPHVYIDTILSKAPFTKKDIPPLFEEVSELKRVLKTAAAGIDAGTKAGGAAKQARCNGVDNPWDIYNFQVPNPVSERLDILLGGKGSRRRTNAALVFYTLSVCSVLDYLLNNENSWAYKNAKPPFFRSVDGLGTKPIFGIDSEVDADKLFRESLKQKASQKEKKDANEQDR